ncbi:MAG: universal stress protein [Candidatus Methylumidiphilus sp.]
MKIMVATDGSVDAIEAARVALTLLRDDAEIVLITVVQDYENPLEMAGGFEGPLLTPEEAEAAYQHQLAEGGSALERTKAALGRDVEIRLIPTDSDPSHAIIDMANELHPELIVLGSGNKGFFWRLFAGSVSDYVLHHSPCPLLVVPHRSHSG